MVEVIRPPTSTTPMDWRSSAPSPMPIAIGSMPKMVESVVISIGRRRNEQASSKPFFALLVGIVNQQNSVFGNKPQKHGKANHTHHVGRLPRH